LFGQCPLINFKSVTINERRRECFCFNESGCTFDAAQRVVQQDKWYRERIGGHAKRR
jgi:hypothetical protein